MKSKSPAHEDLGWQKFLQLDCPKLSDLKKIGCDYKFFILILNLDIVLSYF